VTSLFLTIAAMVFVVAMGIWVLIEWNDYAARVAGRQRPLCPQTRWQLRFRLRRGDAICGHDRCHEAIRVDQAQRIQPPPPPLPLPVSVGEIEYQRRKT